MEFWVCIRYTPRLGTVWFERPYIEIFIAFEGLTFVGILSPPSIQHTQ
jgi:hypothetical protein